MTFPTIFNPFDGMQVAPVAGLPAWGFNVFLQDANGDAANTYWPGGPDISFSIGAYQATENWTFLGSGLPNVSGVGANTGALGAAFLSAVKTFLEGFDWNGSYDWSSISVPTPVSVHSVTVTQISAPTTSDITPV